MPKAESLRTTPHTRVPRLADLTRDAELRRLSLRAERDGTATAVPAARPRPILTGGAARILETSK